MFGEVPLDAVELMKLACWSIFYMFEMLCTGEYPRADSAVSVSQFSVVWLPEMAKIFLAISYCA